MKNVLIVEDEKMIRQGIKTMVQRSGVPVEMILECNNGEMALEMLSQYRVDVMFTDIRMPKMNGIELVQRMQQLEHIPLTVAISGYDDFSYAVEMMRQGVREYLLKPIEREKIVTVLKKLNEEIEEGREKADVNRKIGIQQIKRLIIGEKVTEEKKLDQFLQEELQSGAIGISLSHKGLGEVKDAYEEAKKMRMSGFCNDEKIKYTKDGLQEKIGNIPEKLLMEAKKMTEHGACLQRVQLLGTERAEELESVWKRFFFEVKKGRI